MAQSPTEVNLDTFAARVLDLRNQLAEQLNREVETIALDGTATVIERISQTGIDAQGRKLKPYTKRYEEFKRGAVGTAKREGAKKRAARKVAPASKDKPVGRYRGFVDLTLTGQMLSSIGPVEVREGRGNAVIRVAGRDVVTQQKMDGNDKNRPGWFRLSDDEVRLLAEQSGVRLAELAARILAQ